MTDSIPYVLFYILTCSLGLVSLYKTYLRKAPVMEPDLVARRWFMLKYKKGA